MPTRYTVVCDDDQARAVSRLAHRYGITEEEVLEQLLDLGLEAAEESTV
ncbi:MULTISPECIES: CopG family transcriptional regulator [Halomicrobium]|uniref:CopG family transcriptional regulator n=1 Tax=Halomicrobium mukohataei TaxID=57705 RepID=A0A847TUC7_9EURY|nr:MULTISPECIES: CopG family transcriptional regulator [Halomicrobium]NLV09642.1 CopG family transcriptional regulator [Halomicrobium mukohataei]